MDAPSEKKRPGSLSDNFEICIARTCAIWHMGAVVLLFLGIWLTAASAPAAVPPEGRHALIQSVGTFTDSI
jgi:hypothetical protein